MELDRHYINEFQKFSKTEREYRIKIHSPTCRDAEGYYGVILSRGKVRGGKIYDTKVKNGVLAQISHLEIAYDSPWFTDSGSENRKLLLKKPDISIEIKYPDIYPGTRSGLTLVEDKLFFVNVNGTPQITRPVANVDAEITLKKLLRQKLPEFFTTHQDSRPTKTIWKILVEKLRSQQ